MVLCTFNLLPESREFRTHSKITNIIFCLKLRLAFSRFFYLCGNLGNVKEKDGFPSLILSTDR